MCIEVGTDCPFCQPERVVHQTKPQATGRVDLWMYDHENQGKQEIVVVELEEFSYDTHMVDGTVLRGRGRRLGSIIERTFDMDSFYTKYPEIPRIRAPKFREELKKRLTLESLK